MSTILLNFVVGSLAVACLSTYLYICVKQVQITPLKKWISLYRFFFYNQPMANSMKLGVQLEPARCVPNIMNLFFSWTNAEMKQSSNNYYFLIMVN